MARLFTSIKKTPLVSLQFDSSPKPPRDFDYLFILAAKQNAGTENSTRSRDDRDPHRYPCYVLQS
jgi:hypothetical protein